LGYTLSGGTAYKYQFYAVIGGETYSSTKHSFVTKKETTTKTKITVTDISTGAENTRIGIVTGTNGSYLAINDKPAASPKSSTQIGRIPPGGTVTVYPDKKSGNWYWVSYEGVSGYAYGKYIKLQ
jgi:hypothetical protein